MHIEGCSTTPKLITYSKTKDVTKKNLDPKYPVLIQNHKAETCRCNRMVIEMSKAFKLMKAGNSTPSCQKHV